MPHISYMPHMPCMMFRISLHKVPYTVTTAHAYRTIIFCMIKNIKKL